jgi:hypothetical protein
MMGGMASGGWLRMGSRRSRMVGGMAFGGATDGEVEVTGVW